MVSLPVLEPNRHFTADPNVIKAALAEFEGKYRAYLLACRAGENPSREEIDFYLKQGIPGIDQVAHSVEREVQGLRPSSNKVS